MSGGVLPIAHRGASGVAPENTKIAFVKALDMGVRAIEFDVQLTRDSVPIVFHDDTLERTTNGAGRVADTDFDAIAKLDAGSWFGPRFGRVEVPTLEEVLSAIGPRAMLNVELKPDERVEKLVKHVITSVARFDLFESIVFSSFDPAAIRLLKNHVPEARLGILCVEDGIEEAFALADEVVAVSINPARTIVDPVLVARAHERHLEVWAWTANAHADIERLVAAGVDAIFSDFPDRVRAIAARADAPARGT
jgi:glycerophosphoryl diester phosphodiesterase